MIKNREIKSMNSEEKKKRILELRKELMRLRSQVARGTPPENPGKIKSIRRAIAKLLMFMNKEKEAITKTNE